MNASKSHSRSIVLLLFAFACAPAAVPCGAADNSGSTASAGNWRHDPFQYNSARDASSVSEFLKQEVRSNSRAPSIDWPDPLDVRGAGAGLSAFEGDETFSLMTSVTKEDLQKPRKSVEPQIDLSRAGSGSSGRKRRAHPMTTILIYSFAFAGFALFLLAAREVDGYMNYRRYREWQSPRYPFVIEDRPGEASIRKRRKRQSNPVPGFWAYIWGSICGSGFDPGAKKKVKYEEALRYFCQKPLCSKTFVRPRRPWFLAVNDRRRKVNIARNSFVTDT